MTVWQRRPGPWETPSQPFERVPPEKPSESWVIPGAPEADQLAVVRIRYTVANSWASLPLLGKTPRYLAMIEGSPWRLPVSLPPYLSEFDFPVRIPANQAVRIRFTVLSMLPSIRLHVEEVLVKMLQPDAQQKSFFLSSAGRSAGL